VTLPGAKPFILSRTARTDLASAALGHRQILWNAMAMAVEANPARTLAIPQLLHDWLLAEPAAAPRVLAALARRPAEHPCGVPL
jgi:hypothetical protein